ncbi:unnamed protein product, partial [Penicillium nalgiovense]
MTPDRGSNHGTKRKRGERRRASLACETCRKQKEKCEGGQPCWRCQRLGRPCHFQGQPIPTTTSPCSSSVPVASVPGDENGRIQNLEAIARHFLGDVPLDKENIGRIADKLRSSTDTTLSETALDINEPFDVHFVSNNMAHYSGEFSHWNFSQKLRRKMSCQIDRLDSRVCVSHRKSSKGSDDIQQVKEYWRPTQLQSSPEIIVETMMHLPPRSIADFLITMFFKYVEINCFYIERKWIEEKVALCYSSTK